MLRVTICWKMRLASQDEYRCGDLRRSILEAVRIVLGRKKEVLCFFSSEPKPYDKTSKIVIDIGHHDLEDDFGRLLQLMEGVAKAVRDFFPGVTIRCNAGGNRAPLVWPAVPGKE